MYTLVSKGLACHLIAIFPPFFFFFFFRGGPGMFSLIVIIVIAQMLWIQ